MPHSTEKRWVAVNEQHDPLETFDRILQADAHFIDLDETIAACQATKLICRNVINRRHSSLDIAELAIRAAELALTKEGKRESVKEESWRWYLQTQTQIGSRVWNQMIDDYRPANVLKELFPGAKEVHQIKDIDRYLITRNDKVVAWAFQRALGFTGYKSRAFAKYHAVEEVVNTRYLQRKETNTAVVFGNSSRDADMIEGLRNMEIPVIGVYVSKRVCEDPRISKRFQVQISQSDQRLFAAYLEGRRHITQGKRLEAAK